MTDIREDAELFRLIGEYQAVGALAWNMVPLTGKAPDFQGASRVHDQRLVDMPARTLAGVAWKINEVREHLKGMDDYPWATDMLDSVLNDVARIAAAE